MDNYKKGKQVKELLGRDQIPLPDLKEDFVWMQVADGSKMRNLLKYATKSMEEGKQVVWTALGRSIGKTISCVEILKRKFKAYQVTKICYSKVEDYWDPCNSDLEVLVVKREIPTIHILLSREPVGSFELDFQRPGETLPWMLERGNNRDSEKTEKKSAKDEKRKRRSRCLKQMTNTGEDVHGTLGPLLNAKSEPEIYRSKAGACVLVYNGFEYLFHIAYNGTMRWRCRRHRKNKCLAFLKIRNGKVVVEPTKHICFENPCQQGVKFRKIKTEVLRKE